MRWELSFLACGEGSKCCWVGPFGPIRVGENLVSPEGEMEGLTIYWTLTTYQEHCQALSFHDLFILEHLQMSSRQGDIGRQGQWFGSGSQFPFRIIFWNPVLSLGSFLHPNPLFLHLNKWFADRINLLQTLLELSSGFCFVSQTFPFLQSLRPGLLIAVSHFSSSPLVESSRKSSADLLLTANNYSILYSPEW